MRVLLTAGMIAILLTPTTASAKDICNTYYDIAERIMGQRQQNAALPELMAVIEKNGAPEIQPIMKSIAILAYEQPRFSSEALQRQELQDFANNIYLECLRQLNNQQ